MRTRCPLGLAQSEQLQFASLALESLDIASPEDFAAWIEHSVRAVFPHGMFVAGTVRREGAGQVEVLHVTPVGFPLNYMEAVRREQGAFVCPTLNSWFHEQRPQLFDPHTHPSGLAPWSAEFDKFELRNVAAHGVRIDPQHAVYFSFSQIPGALQPRHELLLRLITPFLHQTYVRACAHASTAVPTPAALTPAEVELLSWVAKGKGNWEIAYISKCSESYIKKKLTRLFAKLGTANRQQTILAAAKAGIL
jgi:DNA-binding CsgD family transcriptional regulator